MCVCVCIWVHLIAVSHMWNGETESSQRTVEDQVSFLLHDMNVITLSLICKCACACVYVLIFYLCYVCYFFSLLSARRFVRRDYNKNWYPALLASYYISFQLRIRYPHDTLSSTPVCVCVWTPFVWQWRCAFFLLFGLFFQLTQFPNHMHVNCQPTTCHRFVAHWRT